MKKGPEILRARRRGVSRGPAHGGMAGSLLTHEPCLASSREDHGPTILYRTLAGQFVLGQDYLRPSCQPNAGSVLPTMEQTGGTVSLITSYSRINAGDL